MLCGFVGGDVEVFVCGVDYWCGEDVGWYVV